MDALRLVSIAAVVLGHAYLTDLSFRQYLEIWRMPLFFFLTGYFWTRHRGLAAELRTRGRTLLVPYLVWSVLITLVVLWWHQQTPTTPEALAGTIERGWYGGADQDPPWWAFWFVSVLFFTTVLRRALERVPTALAWGVGFLGLVLAHSIPESGLARTPLGIGLALPCLLYVLSGEMFRRHVQPRIRRHRTVLGLALAALGTAAVWLGVAPHNIKFSDFGTPVLTPMVGVLMSAGMVLVFSSTVEHALRCAARATGTGRALRSGIGALVRTGTVVILMHGWILMELARAEVDDSLTRFGVALGLSWTTGLVLLATPLAPLLTGAPQLWHPGRRRDRQRRGGQDGQHGPGAGRRVPTNGSAAVGVPDTDERSTP